MIVIKVSWESYFKFTGDLRVGKTEVVGVKNGVRSRVRHDF